MAEADKGWRERWYEVIFEADTRSGKFFDLALIACILLSVVAVMLDSMTGVRARHGDSWGAFGFAEKLRVPGMPRRR